MQKLIVAGALATGLVLAGCANDTTTAVPVVASAPATIVPDETDRFFEGVCTAIKRLASDGMTEVDAMTLVAVIKQKASVDVIEAQQLIATAVVTYCPEMENVFNG